MNPIEQLALAAMQRATETEAPDESSAKSTTSAEQDRPDTEARVALRKERNRQSAASSRKRAKHRTEELEEENNKLRAENEKLRRMLAGYSLGGLVDPSIVPGTAAGGSSHAEATEIDLGAVTTTTTPLNSPPLGPLDEPPDCLQETRVLLPAPTNKRPPTSALEAEVVVPNSCKSLATAVESA